MEPGKTWCSVESVESVECVECVTDMGETGFIVQCGQGLKDRCLLFSKGSLKYHIHYLMRRIILPSD